MALSPLHQKLLLGQAAGGLILNFFLNGAMAWAGFPKMGELPLFARGNCIAGDTIGTSFFLPLTTCLILTPIVRGMLRRGAVPSLARADLPGYARVLPRNAFGRGALLGLVSALTLALLTVFLLSSLGIAAMGRNENVLYKAIYTAILGVFVTPLLGYRALADAEEAR